MSLRAVIEVVIHLESFRNIDLFFQGIYYTRFRVGTEKKLAAARAGAAGPNSAAQGTTPPAGDAQSASAAMPRQDAARVEYAQPYCSYVSYFQQEKAARASKNGPDHHNLLPAQIVDDQQCFLSKAFLIRYCEEEVEINDIALFRAELDVEPEYL